MEFKKDKLKNILTEVAADFLGRESNHTSLITITDTLLSTNNRNITFMISVLPKSSEESALNFAKRQRSDLREKIKKSTRLKFIPTVDFEIDEGEKHRQKIDDISREV